MRGRSLQAQRREQMPGRYGHGGPNSLACDSRYRNGGGGGRHTVDRERFPRYNEPSYDCEYEEDIEQPRVGSMRRDRRERDGPSSPQQNRHLMRYSEDRQMGGGSPRYQRAGRKKNY